MSILSISRKYRFPFGNTTSCVHCEPALRPGAPYSYLYCVCTATKSSPRVTVGWTGFMNGHSCGPSTIRLGARRPVRNPRVRLAVRIGLELVPQVAVQRLELVAPFPVAAGLHQPVDDHQPVAEFVEAGRLIDERVLLDPRHPLLRDCSSE